MNDLDYFALLLIKELKNKNMGTKIIVIAGAQVDFDTKTDIANFKQEKGSPFYSKIKISSIKKYMIL